MYPAARIIRLVFRLDGRGHFSFGATAAAVLGVQHSVWLTAQELGPANRREVSSWIRAALSGRICPVVVGFGPHPGHDEALHRDWEAQHNA